MSNLTIQIVESSFFTPFFAPKQPGLCSAQMIRLYTPDSGGKNKHETIWDLKNQLLRPPHPNGDLVIFSHVVLKEWLKRLKPSKREITLGTSIPDYHRENGGTLGTVPVINNPIYKPYIVGIYWTYPLLKGSLDG